MTRRRLLALGAGVTLAGLMPRPAAAVVRLDITQGNIQPMPIALPDFVGGAPGDAEGARNVSGIITNNLRRSGLFAPIDAAAYIERIVNPDNVPRFPDWRAINAQ
ncbi:MAG: Tol-Pal system protein TolB, partial [Pseudomonadota bacterium]|nr:Tol-Pal system protein TolB [Pseudomonadota bacterium]